MCYTIVTYVAIAILNYVNVYEYLFSKFAFTKIESYTLFVWTSLTFKQIDTHLTCYNFKFVDIITYSLCGYVATE